MAGILRQTIDLHQFKIVFIGDGQVGKTSLIMALKTGEFRTNWIGDEEPVKKLIQKGNRQIMLTMVELHENLAADAMNADAVLLLYDDDFEETIEHVKTKWYSFVNLHFASVPLFLVRSKSDWPSSDMSRVGEDLLRATHAMRRFEVSSMESTNLHLLTSVYDLVDSQRQRLRTARQNDPLNSSTWYGFFSGAIYNSGPVIKQAFVNVREIATNPDSFTDQKRKIQLWLPFCNFGVVPESGEQKEKTRNSKEDAEDDPEEKNSNRNDESDRNN